MKEDILKVESRLEKGEIAKFKRLEKQTFKDWLVNLQLEQLNEKIDPPRVKLELENIKAEDAESLMTLRKDYEKGL